MSTRTILVVFLALVCGAAMAIGVLKTNRPATMGPVATKTERVVIAVANIERGRSLTDKDIAEVDWPKGVAPAIAVRKKEDALKQVAIGQVLEGELILTSKLASGEVRMLEIEVPDGMRAFTVMASKVASNVAGFVLPGSRVDVLLNMRGGGRGDTTGGGSTTTLLQAVKVLAVDQRLDRPEENKVDLKGLSSVTLLVTPEQASKLDLGQNMGALSLSLRNPKDLLDVKTDPATVANLKFTNEPPLDLGETPSGPGGMVEAFAAAMAQRPETPPQLCILTMRGAQRGRVFVDEGGQRQ